MSMAHARPSRLARVLRSLAPLLLLAAPLAATSFVRMEDGALADQAGVIAEVRVDAIQPAPAGGAPATHYQVSVLRLVKGQTAGSSLVVRVLGGGGADGLGLHISGPPEFRPGDRALHVLAASHDGT